MILPLFVFPEGILLKARIFYPLSSIKDFLFLLKCNKNYNFAFLIMPIFEHFLQLNGIY